MIRFDRSARIEMWAGMLIAFGAVDTSKLGSPAIVRIAIACAAIACAVELAAAPAVSIGLISKPPLRWFFLWIAWAGGSAIFAPSGPDAVLVVGLFAVLAVAAIHISKTSGELGLARTLMGAFAVLVITSLLIAAVSGTSIDDQAGRLALLTLEANQLARMAALTAVASAYVLVFGARSASVPAMAAGAAGLIGSILVVIVGGSRTGAAALVAGLIVFVVALAPRSRQRVIASVGAAAMLVVLAVAALAVGGPGELFERLETSAGREEDAADAQREVQSLNGRIDIWPEILTEVADQPISGYGLGNDREVVTGLFAEGRIGWKAQHAHNLALQVLLTTGLVGLVLMVIAIVSLTARVFYAGTPLAPALLVLMLIDGINEAAIRVPSFGWFALIAAAAVASQSARHQLKAENTVVTRSSISSTARS